MPIRTIIKPQRVNIYDIVGQNVADRRELLGMNQVQLAGMTFINRSSIAKIEKGLHRPSLDLLDRIAEALQCQITDLLKGVEDLRDNNIVHNKTA